MFGRPLLQAEAHGLLGPARPLHAARPAVQEASPTPFQPLSTPTRTLSVSGALAGRGRRLEPHVGQARPPRCRSDVAEVGGDVGREVPGRVVDLVVDLCLGGALRRPRRRFPAAWCMTAVPSERELGVREAQVVRVGHDAVGRVLEVAAGAVHTALQHVPDERRLSDPVPVVQRPPQRVADRPDEQRRVREPAAEHDLRVALQARHDRCGADVGVGRDEPVGERVGGRAQLGQVKVGRRRTTRSTSSPWITPIAHARRRRARRSAVVELGRRPASRVGGPEVADDPAAAGEEAQPAAARARPMRSS